MHKSQSTNGKRSYTNQRTLALNSTLKLFQALTYIYLCLGGENLLDVKLLVDGKPVELNEFVNKILGGTIVGAVTSLRGIKKDWKEIKIEIARTG